MSVPQTIEALEEALVGCHDLWRRSPGGGSWPWAGDGPWHLAQGEVGDVGQAEYSLTLLTNEAGRELLVRKIDSARPRVPLDPGEVAERERVTGWLQLVEPAAMRRVVHLATLRLHLEEARVPWKALAKATGWGRTPAALAAAYRRALAGLLCRLNGWPQRRAQALVRGEGLAVAGARARFVVVDDLGEG